MNISDLFSWARHNLLWIGLALLITILIVRSIRNSGIRAKDYYGIIRNVQRTYRGIGGSEAITLFDIVNLPSATADEFCLNVGVFGHNYDIREGARIHFWPSDKSIAREHGSEEVRNKDGTYSSRRTTKIWYELKKYDFELEEEKIPEDKKPVAENNPEG